MFLYTIQPVVNPVWQLAVSCIQPVVKPVVQPGLTTGWTNSGCSFNTVVKLVLNPVWEPVWQPVGCLFTRYSRLSNRLYNRCDNRLYRVNGVLRSCCSSRLESDQAKVKMLCSVACRRHCDEVPVLQQRPAAAVDLSLFHPSVSVIRSFHVMEVSRASTR